MEKIASLIKERPYESDTLQVLEAFVATEFASNNATYSFEANKALIKIYQAFPEHLKAELLANIFEMALIRLPHNDYLLYSSLIPKRIIDADPRMKFIAKCVQLVDDGKFVEFWTEYNSNTDKLKLGGFVDLMRNTLSNIVKMTFQSIPCEELKRYLGIASSSDLEKFAASSSTVEKIENDMVIMTACPENQPRRKIVADSLRFDEALRLVDSLRKAKSAPYSS